MATATPERRLATTPTTTGARGSGGLPGGDAPAAAVPEKKSKKKLIIIGVVGTLVVAAAAYFFLAPAEKPGPPAEGAVTALDAATLNLNGGHYLKIAISVALVAGKDSGEFDTAKANELIINEFSNKNVEDVASMEQREELKKDLLKKMNKAYEDRVFELYITQFVTQ